MPGAHISGRLNGAGRGFGSHFRRHRLRGSDDENSSSILVDHSLVLVPRQCGLVRIGQLGDSSWLLRTRRPTRQRFVAKPWRVAYF